MSCLVLCAVLALIVVLALFIVWVNVRV